MGKKKQLSLCVITKNDEAFLPGCLNDMKDVADEILVADLGSEDRTPELAKQADATIYRPKWENNFSQIENFCMEHAAGEWVLFLQADEVLPPEQHAELKLLLKNPNAEGYLIYVDYNQEERGISSPAQFLRLVRNRKKYRFRYRSFPVIPEEELYSLQDCSLRIAHRGEKTVGWQLEENGRLLKEDLSENPTESYLRYMEGIELLNQEKFKESIEAFEMARRAVTGGYLYVPHLYKCYGYALLTLDRQEKAEEVLTEGIEDFSFYNDLLVLRAQLNHQRGRDLKALEDLETCMTLRTGPNPYVPGPELDGSILREMWEEIKSDLGQEQ
jgi:glycosyltransferase involved in cell wall biosynthesis